jgi:hypothetical protein
MDKTLSRANTGAASPSRTNIEVYEISGSSQTASMKMAVFFIVASCSLVYDDVLLLGFGAV